MLFWLEDLKASSFVAGIVTSGYRLPFISLPSTKFQKNHKSAFKNACFVSSVVRELVEMRCVLECTLQPKICSRLHVVFNSNGKPRLVLDLWFINQYFLNQKFKYEGLSLVSNMFE